MALSNNRRFFPLSGKAIAANSGDGYEPVIPSFLPLPNLAAYAARFYGEMDNMTVIKADYEPGHKFYLLITGVWVALLGYSYEMFLMTHCEATQCHI